MLFSLLSKIIETLETRRYKQGTPFLLGLTIPYRAAPLPVLLEEAVQCKQVSFGKQ
jgi:hypothetical protein